MLDNDGAKWWDLLSSLLVKEWNYHPETLTPDTPLFTDQVAPWMEWVELLQWLSDWTGFQDLLHVDVTRLRCGRDVIVLLNQSVAAVSNQVPH